MQTRKWILALGVAACAAGAAAAAADFDFGLFRDHQLDAHSEQLFGIVSPIEASSGESLSAVEAESDPRNLVTMSKQLHVRVVADLPNVPAEHRHDGAVAHRSESDAPDRLQRAGAERARPSCASVSPTGSPKRS